MNLANGLSFRRWVVGYFPVPASVAITILALLLTSVSMARAQIEEPAYTAVFRLGDCRFKSEGSNPHFILRPGYQLTLEGDEDGVSEKLIATVLDQTKNISVPGYGTVTARVVEEQHFAAGTMVELSNNYFAICDKTNDVYYFGE